jgi:Flp pilus assembly protein TadB
MSAEELQELHEHAEHAAHNRELAPVSLTMALLAVLVAVVSLLGHRAHTEEVVLQSRANDQWSYYQGKDTRLHMDEKLADLESFVAVSDPAKATQARSANAAEAEEYHKQTKEIQAEARKLEHEMELEGRRSDRFDLSEVFLEIALVITSITLLSGRRMFWHLGIVLGVLGIVVAATSLLVR